MSNINAFAQQVNITAKFNADLHNLLEAMGKADVRVMPAGSAVNVYKEGTVNASATAANPGALIDLDGAVPVLDHTVSLTWSKKREIAPYETIQAQGYDVCVGGTADTLVKRSASVVRTALCTAIKSGTGTATQGATFQAAVANAVAALMNGTADEAGEPIVFCSPTAWAGYAGSASIQMQSAMGIRYVENFMGIATLMILPGLEDAKVYATIEENVNLCAAAIGSIANVMTDADGVIGISIEEKPENAGVQVCVYNGVSAFLNVLAKCYKANIGA